MAVRPTDRATRQPKRERKAKGLAVAAIARDGFARRIDGIARVIGWLYAGHAGPSDEGAKWSVAVHREALVGNRRAANTQQTTT